jgi:hypothetical protein
VRIAWLLSHRNKVSECDLKYFACRVHMKDADMTVTINPILYVVKSIKPLRKHVSYCIIDVD